MTEETLFKFQRQMSKNEIADHLDRISEKLRNGEPINFDSAESIEITPSEQSEFEIKIEREDEELSLELEIEWDNSSQESSELEIS